MHIPMSFMFHACTRCRFRLQTRLSVAPPMRACSRIVVRMSVSTSLTVSPYHLHSFLVYLNLNIPSFLTFVPAMSQSRCALFFSASVTLLISVLFVLVFSSFFASLSLRERIFLVTLLRSSGSSFFLLLTRMNSSYIVHDFHYCLVPSFFLHLALCAI